MQIHEVELGPLRFAVVGAGRLGRLLGRALRRRGFEVVGASSRSPESRARATHDLEVPVFDDPVQPTIGADVVLLCVSDDAIASTAEQLATRPADASPLHLRIVHTSGCVSLDALAPLSELGHDVLSVHPLQTITEHATSEDLVGAAAAVTATDTAGETFGFALAHSLGMHPFAIEDRFKPLYHAASSIAANFTVTSLASVLDLARTAGVTESVATSAFARLLRSAADRVEREGPADALTGPIVRGDTATIGLHLKALDSEAPEHASMYRSMAHATVRLAVSAGRLDVDTAARVERELGPSGQAGSTT